MFTRVNILYALLVASISVSFILPTLSAPIAILALSGLLYQATKLESEKIPDPAKFIKEDITLLNEKLMRVESKLAAMMLKR